MNDMKHLWTIADVCAATDGRTNDNATATKADSIIAGISIDSREIRVWRFICGAAGLLSDGHRFLAAAQSAGASAALVSKINGRRFATICVTNCLQALHQLGAAGRARFGGIQFGITGSVSKQDKEMLRHVLSQFGSCHASQRSFNNHIGVLSLANLPQNTEFAVQEMGMNAAGEIAELTKLTRPQIALIPASPIASIAFFSLNSRYCLSKSRNFPSH